MGDDDGDLSDLEKWDPGFIRGPEGGRPIGKIWFRAEVRGLERMPPTGGALLVSNHSSGAMTPDVLVLAPAFYEKLGYDRPLYTWRTTACSRRRWPGHCGRSASSSPPARTPPRPCPPVGWCWCSPAGTTTLPVDVRGRTPSTSTAERDTCARPLRPTCRSCRRCRSAARRTQLFLGRGTPHRQAAGVAEDPDRHLAAGHRFSVRCDVDDPGQLPAAVEDRARGARAYSRCRSSSVRIGCRRVTRMCAR